MRVLFPALIVTTLHFADAACNDAAGTATCISLKAECTKASVQAFMKANCAATCNFCAVATPSPVSAAGSIDATATFSMNGVSGTIKFSQNTNTSPTLVDIDLSGLNYKAKAYHVHLKPTNTVSTNGLCSDASVGGHFDTHAYTHIYTHTYMSAHR